MKLVEVTPQIALPCSPQTFKVKGKPAFLTDFGRTHSINSDGTYCMLSEFIPNITPKRGVLKKYDITNEQYSLICDTLAEMFYIEDCDLCGGGNYYDL